MKKHPALVLMIAVLAVALGAMPAQAQPQGQAQGKPGGGSKSFEDAIEGATRHEGLFTLYEKGGKYLMELRPEQLDTDYMVSITRETGIGQLGLLAAQVLGEIPIRFHKVGDGVQLLLRNTRFMALDDPDVRRAVDRSFSDSLHATSKIESEPHPKTEAVLVDAKAFFVADVEALGVFFAEQFKAAYIVDAGNSYLDGVKVFPRNIEVGARVHFDGKKPITLINLPDSRSMFITYRYSISEVPDAPGFLPRIADDRVGHFLAMYQDFSDDRAETPYVRYVTRWDLQKEEPYADVSKPIEPITYWLENSIPKKYRQALADGALMWNDAFERIGFKDAVVVKQQPDDADWDPADVRYSTIRWFIATDTAFAIGPSRINPLTGQIYDADIGWSEGLIRGRVREYEELSDPVAAINTMFEELSAMSTSTGDPRFSCRIAAAAADQLSFGLDLLLSRGIRSDSPEADEYVNGFIKYVSAHEVGHTLGLRHNFRASSIREVGHLQDTATTRSEGLVGSVMDYVPVNLAPNGQSQGQYWQTTLGPYDHWAIEYAYKPFPGVSTPEAELPELVKIAVKVAEAGKSYGTDEDTGDPLTNIWDLGHDPIAFYSGRVDLVRELWKSIPTELATEGEGYQVMRRAFGRGLGQFGLAVFNVTKTVGGMHTYRDHVADPGGRLPLQPVPASTQRQALRFLTENLFSASAFEIPPDLVNRLAPSRWWDFEFSIFGMPRFEYPLHDVVLAIQENAIETLYSPVKLDRLVDMELHFASGEERFTMAGMFDEIQSAVWSEVYGGSGARVNSFRRALQRKHLNTLIDLIVAPEDGAPDDAGTLARAGLVSLKKRIDTAMGSAADQATRAHLDESRARIDAALSAQMMRFEKTAGPGQQG